MKINHASFISDRQPWNTRHWNFRNDSNLEVSIKGYGFAYFHQKVKEQF